MTADVELGAKVSPNPVHEREQKESQRRKDEARARILAKLIPEGELYGTLSELRKRLGLEDMSMRLFKEGCRYLSGKGSNGLQEPRIIFQPVGERDRGYRTSDPQAFRLKFIVP